MKTIRIGIVAALVAASVALALVLQPGEAATAPESSIVVQGTGSVTTVPDRGAFSFGVVTPAKTATAAVQANGAAMTKLVAALEQAGVAAADLQTTQVSLDVQFAEGGGSVTGYTATSSVTAQLRDLAAAGKLVDAAVAAGADSVSGPSLSKGDTGALYRDALKRAVAAARTKAESLAAAGGLTLGRITAVSESGAEPVPVFAAAKADSTGIEPGTQQITATVTVTFATS
ncbi:MAG TPA: SIMPL domain-containing protein [Gaiellaceae bacterium]|nr:SIMPL domain-containing protein [Gaiellaceae bacterium]